MSDKSNTTNPVPAPTPADLGRDLAADLAECERRCGKGWVLWVCDNADPGWPAAIRRALAAESRVDELRRGFDLRWKATQRAIARWRAEDPAGRELEQPDHADLCCWLMDRLTTAEAECERLRDTMRRAANAIRLGLTVTGIKSKGLETIADALLREGDANG